MCASSPFLASVSPAPIPYQVYSQLVASFPGFPASFGSWEAGKPGNKASQLAHQDVITTALWLQYSKGEGNLLIFTQLQLWAA